MLWAVRGRPPRRGDRILGAVLVGGRRLGASQTRTDQQSATRLSESNLCRRGQDRGDVDVLSFRLDVGHRVGHGYNGTPRCCS